MFTSPEWTKTLRLLRPHIEQILSLDCLLLFEFDPDATGEPVLVLRETIGTAPVQALLPLSLGALSHIRESVSDPLVVQNNTYPTEVESIVSPLRQAGYTSTLVSGMQHDEILWGCLVGSTKDHRTFNRDDISSFSLLASSLSIVLENVHLRHETAFHLSEIMSLQTVGAVLVEDQSLEGILEVIIEEAIRLLHAREALVLLLKPDDKWFQVRARRGPGVSGLTNSRMSVEDSLNGLVVMTGKPLVSNNVQEDGRANVNRARRLRVKTVVIAPLKIRNEVLGTIAVHNKIGGYFSQVDVEVLCSFANQAAITIDNARLYHDLLRTRDEVERYAAELQNLCFQTMQIQEDERRRIATEIHDRVISRIVAALYQIETCKERYQRLVTIDESFTLLRELLDETVDVSRKCIYEIWPATLDQIGLLPALRELTNRLKRHTKTEITVSVSGQPFDLDQSISIVAYRIAQEALNNVMKHALASRVEITTRYSGQGFRLVVQDNGGGFDVLAKNQELVGKHFGLIGMRERALSVGGTLRIVSVPGRGCRVVLEIPKNN